MSFHIQTDLVVMIVTTADIILLLFLYVRSLFPVRDSVSPWVRRACGAALMIGIAVLSLVPVPIIARVLCAFAGILVFVVRFYHAAIPAAIFASLVYCSITAISNTLSVVILGQMGAGLEELPRYGPTAGLARILSCLILTVPVLVIAIISRKGNRTFPARIALPLLPGIILSILVCLHVLYHTIVYAGSPWVIWYMLLLLYLNIVFVFYAETLHRVEQERAQRVLLEQQYQMQREYYRELRRNQEETRSLWHDIEKYILAMQACAGENAVDGANDVVHAAERALHDIQPIVDTDNEIISSILNYYVSKASRQGIRVQLDVIVPDNLAVSAVDLSIIIGNTLDNAIHACSEIPQEQRWIHIKMRQKNRVFYYNIRNPLPQTIIAEQDPERVVKQVVKPVSPLHGYGLGNVQACVRKYAGSMTIRTQEQIFDLSVRLNVPDVSVSENHTGEVL